MGGRMRSGPSSMHGVPGTLSAAKAEAKGESRSHGGASVAAIADDAVLRGPAVSKGHGRAATGRPSCRPTAIAAGQMHASNPGRAQVVAICVSKMEVRRDAASGRRSRTKMAF